MSYKLGSLFDGSGGFPLAGALCGVDPCWASEVEPYPIAVTRSRFPNVKHLGDISKIHGGEIEPVDIITFGSPCQDLSVAGKRAGLKHEANGDEETTRSGLFMEAVRIIKEMRAATNGKYPRFALWENVPGAFSSNKGEDFRIVCEELIKIVEPRASMPEVPKNGWAYADSYVGDGWSLAYRTFDAQYWGVPQRRRRIHLIADFRGECAREVLFEREGVRGYFAQGRTPWQTTPTDAQGCTGADDREGESRGRLLTPSAHGCPDGLLGDRGLDAIGADLYNQALTGDKAATLSANSCMTATRNGPSVIERDGGLGAVALAPVAATLRAGAGAPKHEQDFVGRLVLETAADSCILDDQGGQQINVRTDGKAPTLRAETHGNLPCVIEPQGADIYNLAITGDKVCSLTAGGYNSTGTSPKILQPIAVDQGAGKSACSVLEDKAPTLATTHGGSPAVAYGNPPRYIVRRLTPTECARLQGFADCWGHVEKKDSLTDEEFRFWLEVRNTHAAINGKKVQDYTEKQMLTWYNKLWTDSAEYKMWGNGIALPPALYCLQGIVDALNKPEESDDEWML